MDWPGKPFTEFRGAAIDIGNGRRSPQQAIVEEWAADAGIAGRQRRQSLRLCLNRNRDLFRALLEVREASLPGEPDPDVNCVLCEVLDGNAIYGSSLAKVEVGASHKPLRYFVLSNGLSGYQLGRLLRRLHVLGELRLAAMLDLQKLRRAGIEIRALGNWIIAEQHGEGTADAKSAHGSKGAKIDFTKLQQKLIAIAYLPPPPNPSIPSQADDKNTSQTDPSIAGGLPYRVNRSRSYAQAFKNRVIELRVRRLEGWEPYDLFVQRTLYQEFDFIDAVGRRYEAMEARVQRLTQAQNLGELEEVERDMRHILAIGEIIGWTAFAYYLSRILTEIGEPLCHKVSALPVCPWLGKPHNASFASALAAAVLALLLGIAFKKRWFRKLRAWASRPRTSNKQVA